MRRLLLPVFCVMLSGMGSAACADGDDPPPPKSQDTCSNLEQPGTLARPPAGKLPCELLPPGLKL